MPERGAAVTATVLAASAAVVALLLSGATRRGAGGFSSFDTSPAGASALFGAYGRAGLNVVRGADTDSISLQPPTTTTAFVIAPKAWSADFDAGLEAFLKAGGRLVVLDAEAAGVAPAPGALPAPAPAPAPKPGEPKPPPPAPLERDLGMQLGGAQRAQPYPSPYLSQWAQPVPGALPAGVHPLPLAAPQRALPSGSGWGPLYLAAGLPVMEQRAVGRGTLVLATEAAFVGNDNLARNADAVLLAWLAGGRPEIFVDESTHGYERVRGTLWLMQRWRLTFALALLPVLVGLTAWWLAAGLERPPERPSELGPDAATEMVAAQPAGLGWQRLLERVTPPGELAAACWRRYLAEHPEAKDTAPASRDSVVYFNEMRAAAADRRSRIQ